MNSVEVYRQIVFPLIERLDIDPETAHDAVKSLLKFLQSSPLGLTLISHIAQFGTGQIEIGEKSVQKIEIGPLRFHNHVILAEGFDKNAEIIPAMLALGFAGVIVGTVTEVPQEKNPGKVLHRLSNGSLLNYHGFGNKGAEYAAVQLEELRKQRQISQPIGISIGMNRWTTAEDSPRSHAQALAKVLPFVDFAVFDPSSPNTKTVRGLLEPDAFQRTALAMRNVMEQSQEHTVPLFAKLSPDMQQQQLEKIILLCRRLELAGVIATNTSINQKLKEEMRVNELPGGLSGRVIGDLSTKMIRTIHEIDPTLPIIGMGGVESPETAEEKLDAGATLLGLYSGLIYHGPGLPSFLAKELQKMHSNV